MNVIDKIEDSSSNTSIQLESKLSHLEELLKEKLEKAYQKQTSNVSLFDIAKIAAEYAPIDLAYAVVHLPIHARPVLFDNLPDIDSKLSL